MIRIDTQRFRKIFRKIFGAYVLGTGVFKDLRAENFGPQNLHRPKGVEFGDANHLYWLTLAGLSDKRTTSATLYPRFARMFSRNPSLFERGRYPSLSRMTELYRRYAIALPRKEIAFFIERKRHLDELFGGDPLAMYAGVRNIQELMKKLRAIGRAHGIKNVFPGAKKKMFSLLAMFLSEFADLDFEDVVPVDVWVQSICASTGVLKGEGRITNMALGHQLRPHMTRVFAEFKATKGASNATWIHGRALCRNCENIDMSSSCAIYSHCRGPFRRARNAISGLIQGTVDLPADFVPKAADA